MTAAHGPAPPPAGVDNHVALRAALDRIDVRDARALVLMYVDGLTLAEVAAAARQPVAVVRRRVARAMVELGRVLLEDQR